MARDPRTKPLFECPQCGSTNVDRDEVDIGVGTVMGPWSCYDCEWSERNIEDDDAPDDTEQFGGSDYD